MENLDIKSTYLLFKAKRTVHVPNVYSATIMEYKYTCSLSTSDTGFELCLKYLYSAESTKQPIFIYKL